MVLFLADVAGSVGGWSTFFLALLGILAFFGTLYGVAQARRDAERARTLDYLRRLYDPEFAPLNTQVLAFIRTANPDAFSAGAHLAPDHDANGEEVAAAFAALDLETEARIVSVLNFYEELSCSYRAGLLDTTVANKMLAPTLVQNWALARPFIEQQREETKARLLKAGGKPKQSAQTAKEVMEEWEEFVKSRANPPPPSWVEKLDPLTVFEGSTARIIGVLAAALIFGGLVAVGIAAAAQDVPTTRDSFLVAVAATFAVLAVVALTPSLSRSRSPGRLLLTGALAGTLALSLTTGLTIALDLTAAVGPAGETGKRGPVGRDGARGGRGAQGEQGGRGEEGRRGERGRNGPRGPRGDRGAAGPSGPQGPRGQRGYSWDGS
jgi:VIT1/CCC1 family predicted Fe2+/Mn2+ transporter